jgi:hypothetical protein
MILGHFCIFYHMEPLFVGLKGSLACQFNCFLVNFTYNLPIDSTSLAWYNAWRPDL